MLHFDQSRSDGFFCPSLVAVCLGHGTTDTETGAAVDSAARGEDYDRGHCLAVEPNIRESALSIRLVSEEIEVRVNSSRAQANLAATVISAASAPMREDLASLIKVE